jgi:hypothetical protein
MHDSYEPPASYNGRPWAARLPGWAGHGQQDDGPAYPDQPPTPPGRSRVPPPDWAGHGLGQDPLTGPPDAASTARLRRPDWAAQDPYPGHAHSSPPEHRPADPLARDSSPHYPIPRYPTPPSQPPYPTRTMRRGRSAWADFDPYFSYQHPAYARTAALSRLSRLTWRAVELSTVAAAGLVVLFARNAQGATSHVVAVKPTVSPSVHAAATQQAHHRHKPKRRHAHHSSSPATPALAPPSAPPAPPPPPPPAPPPPAPAPAPPPPPVTTSGGSGGG